MSFTIPVLFLVSLLINAVIDGVPFKLHFNINGTVLKAPTTIGASLDLLKL